MFLKRVTPTSSSEMKTKPAYKCKTCKDSGIKGDGETHYQNIGVTGKRFCDQCEKGNKMFRDWFYLPEQQKQHQKFKQDKIARALRLSNLSPVYLKAKLEDLKNNKALEETCKLYLENWKKIKPLGLGYYFWGNVGAGKTYTAAILANELMKQHFVEVLFLKMPEAVARIKKSFGSDKKDSDKNLFEKMRDAEMLILDDLGIEKVSDWLADEIYQVVEHRYSNNLPMIITSNQSLDDLAKIYREQVSSRITEKTKSIKFTQKDKRQKLGEEIKQTLF